MVVFKKHIYLILFSLIFGISSLLAQSKKVFIVTAITNEQLIEKKRLDIIYGLDSNATQNLFKVLDSIANVIQEKTKIDYMNDKKIYNVYMSQLVLNDTNKYTLESLLNGMGKIWPSRTRQELITVEYYDQYCPRLCIPYVPILSVITGVFESKKEARKQLKKIKKIIPTAEIQKSRI